MAKCKLLSKETGQCMATDTQWRKCKPDTCPMDKYTTENCNMKRKPKYKKIKAWARIMLGGEIDATDDLYCKKLMPIPCTIVINSKYLKDKK